MLLKLRVSYLATAAIMLRVHFREHADDFACTEPPCSTAGLNPSINHLGHGV